MNLLVDDLAIFDDYSGSQVSVRKHVQPHRRREIRKLYPVSPVL